MIDILEELLRKIRPYELTKGNADAAFEQAMDAVIDGLSSHGVNGAKHGFAKAIGIMKQVPYDCPDRRGVPLKLPPGCKP